jgi:hypothetical protein
MKKAFLPICLLLLLASCSKDNTSSNTNNQTNPKTTGHLYVKVDLTNVVNASGIPANVKTGAEGRLYLDQNTSVPLLYREDTVSANQKIKTLDFGELNPGLYDVWYIDAWYDDNTGNVAGALGSTRDLPTVQISANHDDTLTITM